MFYSLAVGAVLLLHLAFILFVVGGAALVLRWRWIAAVHLPAVVWGVLVELTGRGCPLTWAENFLRMRAGQGGYSGDFLEHYLLWLIYPAGLTREVQLVLAGSVFAINLVLYGRLWFAPGRRRRRRSQVSKGSSAWTGVLHWRSSAVALMASVLSHGRAVARRIRSVLRT